MQAEPIHVEEFYDQGHTIQGPGEEFEAQEELQYFKVTCCLSLGLHPNLEVNSEYFVEVCFGCVMPSYDITGHDPNGSYGGANRTNVNVNHR